MNHIRHYQTRWTQRKSPDAAILAGKYMIKKPTPNGIKPKSEYKVGNSALNFFYQAIPSAPKKGAKINDE